MTKNNDKRAEINNNYAADEWKKGNSARSVHCSACKYTMKSSIIGSLITKKGEILPRQTERKNEIKQQRTTTCPYTTLMIVKEY